jgi:4-hydroxythreonine-4-phosphate dehydrogenase
MNNILKIGISQGDTNGIGWEIILKILADSRLAELCTPVVYGSPTAASYY